MCIYKHNEENSFPIFNQMQQVDLFKMFLSAVAQDSI